MSQECNEFVQGDDPFDAGRWVVLQGFEDDLEQLNGRIARIVEEDVIDRYQVEVPASDYIERQQVVADKDRLVPVSEWTTMSMQLANLVDDTGEVIPCYQHWNGEQEQMLESHIRQVESYNSSNKDYGKPTIPEWYLYSLKATLRKWGAVPADYADVPPMRHANERCVHIEPRNGFLEVTLMLKNREWKNRDRALQETLNIMKDSVVTGNDRATLVSFEANSGGHPEPACEDTTAVFVITKDSLPLALVKPNNSIPEVLLRMH